MIRLKHLWETLRSTYWFVPALMTTAAAVVAVATITLDRRHKEAIEDRLGWIFSGGEDGARAVLEVIAATVMSTAGIVFSITIAALSLASQQLGPRLLQNFMRDTGNQVVLGTFIATFLYCLLVLRTIRGEDEGDFVPAVSVTFGVFLALASVAVLIYFIHHVSVSIQAPQVVADVGSALARTVESTFPDDEDRTESPPPVPELPEGFDERAAVLPAGEDGYVQALAEEELVELAAKGGCLLVVEARPGHFVRKGAPLARLWPPEAMDGKAEKKLRRRFVVGPKRTAEQDVEFAADQLAEVAVRALSPSLNDPFTAVSCLDWLGAALCRAARGREPGPVRTDEAGEPRLVYRSPLSFAGLADRAFDKIRQNGAQKASVAIRMLEVIAEVVPCTGGDRDRVLVLLRHARQVHRAAAAAIEDPLDRVDLEERFRRVEALCGVPLPEGAA
jgi:uncharacterized membrane protein